MALITLDEAMAYLRVDSTDEVSLINSLILSAGDYCAEIGRLTDEEWAKIEADPTDEDSREVQRMRNLLKIAMLYTIGYLYEHREEANHNDLALTLRNLLFSIRERRGWF